MRSYGARVLPTRESPEFRPPCGRPEGAAGPGGSSRAPRSVDRPPVAERGPVP